jgi:hypothetical protein
MFTKKPDNSISSDLHVPGWGEGTSPLVSANGNVCHKDAKHYQPSRCDNKGTDTEQRDLLTPRYPEQEGVEKFSRSFHITSKVHGSHTHTKKEKSVKRYNPKRLVALLKVESSFYLQEAASNGETSLGNAWWLYWLVPTSRLGSCVDVSRLNRP